MIDEPYTPERPARPRRGGWWIALGGWGLGLAVCTVVAWPIATGKTEPPRFARAVAEHALAEARKSGGARWAPERLTAAESALRASLLEYRIQEVRFLPFRDYGAARSLLEAAENAALVARDESLARREAARTAADAALVKATEDGTASETFADAMNLGPFERKLLQKSRILLAESRIRYGDEAYEQSASLAREASSLARQVSQNAAEVAGRFTHPGLVRNWRRMIDETISWSRRTGGNAIVVLKEDKRLDLYNGGRLLRSYRADMGYRSLNDKLRSGDGATPEGRYRIIAKRGPGSAAYYKALDLDYPNGEDRAEFARLKRAGRLPRAAKLGGSIQIHGEGGRGRDWTRGCVAIANSDMDDLFRRVAVGTPVTIVGGNGRGTYARLARQHANTVASETR